MRPRIEHPRIEPHGWRPPPPRASITEPVAPPTLLEINGTGPEDVALDAQGRIITGVDDGRLLRLTPDGNRIDTLATTGGRPLGIETLPDGHLLVCDAHRGLLRVDGDRVSTLVAPGGPQRLALCNNAAVSTDGTVYFSDSSQRFPLHQYRRDLMEHSGTGRLLRRDPDGRVEVLLDGLHFANGVALAADESFVAVAETGAYRLTRRWLTGARAGSTDTLAAALPGFPDNISTGPDGTVWISLASPRDRMLDWAHAHAPRVLRLVAAAPERWQPREKPVVWVLGVDATGRVVHDLHTTHDRFHMVTGVRAARGALYLGSLTSRAVGVLDLPD